MNEITKYKDKKQYKKENCSKQLHFNFFILALKSKLLSNQHYTCEAYNEAYKEFHPNQQASVIIMKATHKHTHKRCSMCLVDTKFQGLYCLQGTKHYSQ